MFLQGQDLLPLGVSLTLFVHNPSPNTKLRVYQGPPPPMPAMHLVEIDVRVGVVFNAPIVTGLPLGQYTVISS